MGTHVASDPWEAYIWLDTKNISEKTEAEVIYIPFGGGIPGG